VRKVSELRALLTDLDGTLLDSVRPKNIPQGIWKVLVFLSAYRIKTPWFWKRFEYLEARTGWPRHLVVPELEAAIRSFRNPPQRVVGVVTNRGAFSAVSCLDRTPLRATDFDLIHTSLGIGDERISLPPGVKYFSHTGFKNRATFGPILEFLEEKYGIAKNEVAYVGDDLSDYTSSRAAGISFFASTWGRRKPEEFLAAGLSPEFVLNSPADIFRHLGLGWLGWHPGADVLADFLDGECSLSTYNEVVKHLEFCKPCRQVVDARFKELRQPAAEIELLLQLHELGIQVLHKLP